MKKDVSNLNGSKQITALIHSDSPTIRADLVSSKLPIVGPVEQKKRVRRSGSSGTVLEFLPMQMETYIWALR